MKSQLVIILSLIHFSLFACSEIYAQSLPGGVTQKELTSKEEVKNDPEYSFNVGINFPYYFNDVGWELSIGGANYINKNFSLGFNFAYLISTNVSMESKQFDPNPILTMFTLELSPAANLWFGNSLCLAIGVDAGFGQANYSSSKLMGVPIDPAGQWFIYFKPNLDISIEVLRDNYIRIGGGYRKIVGYELEDISSSDISGAIFKISYQMMSR